MWRVIPPPPRGGGGMNHQILRKRQPSPQRRTRVDLPVARRREIGVSCSIAFCTNDVLQTIHGDGGNQSVATLDSGDSTDQY